MLMHRSLRSITRLRTSRKTAYYCCCCLSTLAGSQLASGLHIAVVTGTTRISGPPPVLGPQVSQFVVHHLENVDECDKVSVLDPRELELPLLEKPAFAYAKSQIPETLQRVEDILKDADAYVMISPEYNHAASPALINILNHFGSSIFSYKPSAIVTYSAGQWGGTRAALSLRPILSELGCLPVSAMIHFPNAGSVLDNNGDLQEGQDPERWEKYLRRCSSQLVWWAQATRNHRMVKDPFKVSAVLKSNPAQRNAP